MGLQDTYGTLDEQRPRPEPAPPPTTTTTTAPPTTDAPAPTGSPLERLIAASEGQAAEGARIQNGLGKLENAETEVDLSSIKDVLEALGRLSYVADQKGDSEMRSYIGDRLKATEAHWSEDDLKLYGLDRIDIPDDPNAIQRIAGGVMNAPGISHFIEYFQDVGEGFATAWALANADDTNRHMEMIAAIGRGVSSQNQPDDLYGMKDVIDEDGDGFINFREILGLDADLGGSGWFGDYIVGGLDTLGLILTDPSSYLTLGLGSKVKIGMGAVRDVGGDAGEALVAQVKRSGMKSLPREIQQEIYYRLKTRIDDSFNQGNQRRTIGDRLAGRESTKASSMMDDQLSRLYGPQGRIGFVGNSVRTPLDPLLDRLPGRTKFGPLKRQGDHFDGVYGAGLSDELTDAYRAQTKHLDPGKLGTTYGADITRRGVSKLPGVQKLVKAGDLIRPRASIRRLFGEKVSYKVDDIRSTAAGISEHQYMDMGNRLNAAARKAAKEQNDSPLLGRMPGNRTRSLRKGIEDADVHVREGLDGGAVKKGAEGPQLSAVDSAEAAAKRLDDAGMPATAQYLRVASQVREEIGEAAVKAGLDPSFLNQRYLPRSLTRKGQDVLAERDELARDLGYDPNKLDRGEFGYHKSRTGRYSDMSVDEANEAIAKDLGLPEGTKIFEDQVLAAFGARGRSAFKAAAMVDQLNGLQKVLHNGVPLGVWDDGSDLAKKVKSKHHYAAIDTPNGSYLVPREIRKELNEVRDVLIQDSTLRGASEFMENWSKTWGAWATSPLIDGIGFHARNAAGNLMLNAIKGVVNPKLYAEAMSMQRSMAKAVRTMKKNPGMTFDDALKKTRLSPRQLALLKGARDHEVLGAGFFDEIKLSQDANKVWKVLGENKMITTGRTFGSAVESNARLAHYIHMIDSGMTGADAARSVRMTLFDYGDLTAAERRIRYVSRFYTFMRKNTGFQLWALAHHPGRVGQMVNRIGQPGVSEILGLNQPEYSAARGDSLLNVLGKEGTISGIDAPFAAAMETLEPVMLLAREIFTDEDITADQYARSLMNLTSGGPRAFTDLVYEKLMDKSAFTGAPDKGGNENFWMRVSDTIVGPAWSQLDRVVGRATEGEGLGPLGNNLSDSQAEIGHELLVLSNLLGLNVAPTNEGQARNWLISMTEELDAALKKIPNAPTIEQLRRNGILEEPVTISRPSSAVLTESIEKDQAAGLDTTALETLLDTTKADEAAEGYQYAEDGSYTTRAGRARSLSESLGLVNEDGSGRLNNSVKALYNRENPGDPFLNDEGEVIDVYNVDVLWETTGGDVADWAEETGAPLTPSGNVGAETRRAWNAAHPDRPYYRTQRDRIAAGLLPLQGVFTDPDGVDWFPQGQSVNDWKLSDILSDGSIGPQSQVLAPQPQSGGGGLGGAYGP